MRSKWNFVALVGDAMCVGSPSLSITLIPLAGRGKQLRTEGNMDGDKHRVILQEKPVAVCKGTETGMEVHLPAGQ